MEGDRYTHLLGSENESMDGSSDPCKLLQLDLLKEQHRLTQFSINFFVEQVLIVAGVLSDVDEEVKSKVAVDGLTTTMVDVNPFENLKTIYTVKNFYKEHFN